MLLSFYFLFFFIFLSTNDMIEDSIGRLIFNTRQEQDCSFVI